MKAFTLKDFLVESNRIEGIEGTNERELAFTQAFLTLNEIRVSDLENLVRIYQPDAVLRDGVGLNVYVGDHTPIPGGPEVKRRLQLLLDDANEKQTTRKAINYQAFFIHHEYEWLHPFTDGNGRSGRALWLWIMRDATLGFLHHWYYQTLQFAR